MTWKQLVLLLVLALAAGPARATSIRSLSLEEMLEGAELVFEGRVARLETRAGARHVETCAEFEVLEVVSGPPVASPLTLCFAGGDLGARRYRVGGLRVPAAGEHGIYFVESLDAPRLNPLYGWSQGHFRITGSPDAVHTADGQPVLEVEDGRELRPRGPSDGVARGVRVAPRGRSGGAPALSGRAFKARLRALLERRP